MVASIISFWSLAALLFALLLSSSTDNQSRYQNFLTSKMATTTATTTTTSTTTATTTSTTTTNCNTPTNNGTPPTPAIVLLDPVTDWKQVVQAAHEQNYTCIVVLLSPIPIHMKHFYPTQNSTTNEGVAHFLDLQDYDCFGCITKLRLLQQEYNLQIEGFIPLSETAVETNDVLTSMMGLQHYNPLSTLHAKRGKGTMKETIQSVGLPTAKFARISTLQDLTMKMKQLNLSFPIVLKTPLGMSTSQVFICHSMNESQTALQAILSANVAPDGRQPLPIVLLEEYITGTEFAINVMVYNRTNILVTDLWKYTKDNSTARYGSAINCDPHDDEQYHEIISYAKQVAQAVGIHYGAGHVELKAQEQNVLGNDQKVKYTNPILMEVGARLSGGRKALMTQLALNHYTNNDNNETNNNNNLNTLLWNPFEALISCHTGKTPKTIPSNFTPIQSVQHLFLPLTQTGKIEKVLLETESLTTLHSHFMLIKPGDAITEISSAITSCAGFVWLVGPPDQVEADAIAVRSSFKVVYYENDTTSS